MTDELGVVQAIVLAIIQGITEFLPISSSGHLILGSWLFDWPDQGLVFDGAIHLGTLGAVLVYFRREWAALVAGLVRRGDVAVDADGGDQAAGMAATRLWGLLVVGSVPLAIIGFLLKDAVEDHVRSPEAVGGLLLASAAVLLAAELIGRRLRAMETCSYRDSSWIGLAQAVAIVPGISRSGMTITACMAANMTREAAVRFSFLLAVPAIAGSGLFLVADALANESLSGRDWALIGLGIAVSFVTGYLAIAGLLRVVRTWSFVPFIVYMTAAGTAVLIARAAGV